MVAAVIALLGGCGAGSTLDHDGAVPGSDGDAVVDTGGAGFFITMDVDGVTKRVDTGIVGYYPEDYAFVTNPLTTLAIGVKLLERSGTGGCEIDLHDDMGGSYYSDTCTATVTQPGPNLGDVMAGTFAGTLSGPFGPVPSVPITNGAYRAPHLPLP